jgi:predicted Zn-dependent protease
MSQGKWDGAEQAARRWVRVQPDAPSAWATLALVLAYTQRQDASLDAIRRAVSLAGHDPATLDLYARLLLMARRYDAVDSIATVWRAGQIPDLRPSGYDLELMLARERGQFRASNDGIARMVGVEAGGSSQVLGVLMRGNNLGRMGEYAAATALYERSAHPPGVPQHFPPRNNEARGYCWHHALLADAIAPSGDLRRLRGIADTLALGCARSYYGRDRLLVHHVRGLIAMQEGRWADAESELQRARWSVSDTWTRTNALLAQVRMQLGRPLDAIATLRDAYASSPDAMGRYEPRTGIDRLMAMAFRQAGQPDSAAVYEALVARAWRNADPEPRTPVRSLASR